MFLRADRHGMMLATGAEVWCDIAREGSCECSTVSTLQFGVSAKPIDDPGAPAIQHERERLEKMVGAGTRNQVRFQWFCRRALGRRNHGRSRS